MSNTLQCISTLDNYCQRIIDALNIATQYGTIDGAHHKMWAIDQMVRTLTGTLSVTQSWSADNNYYDYVPDYDDFVRDRYEGGYEWSTGIAP